MNLYCRLLLVSLTLTGCKEIKAPGLVKDPDKPKVEKCKGDTLIGHWTTSQSATQVYTFFSDCVGYHAQCQFYFQFEPEPYGASSGVGWSDLDHFKITYLNQPNATVQGCQHYAWNQNGYHWCVIDRLTPTRMNMDCNGLGNNYFTYDRD